MNSKPETGSARERQVILDATECRISVARPKDCVLLMRIEGRAPKHFEAALTQRIHAACSSAYHLELFLDLDEARAFPMTTAAWIAFIDEHAVSFGHIYILATTRENKLAAAIVQHLIARKDLVTIIEQRRVFENCLAISSDGLSDGNATQTAS